MDLKIYTTPTCAWCKKLKEWLKKKKQAYQEIDLVENETARDEVLQKTGQLAVPIIEFDGKIMVGFDEKKLEEALISGQK